MGVLSAASKRFGSSSLAETTADPVPSPPPEVAESHEDSTLGELPTPGSDTPPLAAEVEEAPSPPPEVIESSPARAPFTPPPKPEPIRRVTTQSGRYGPTRTIEIEPLLWSPTPPLETLLDVFPASRREEIRSAVKSNPQGMGILTLMHCRGCDRYDALELLGLDPWKGWFADEVETIEETAA